MQEGNATPLPESAAEQRAVSVSIDDRGVVKIHVIGQPNVSAISAEDLKCAVCYEVPPGEVHQCSRGHFLCLSCWNRMDRAPERLCGECRVPLPLSNRNLVAERAIQGLPQPPEQPNTPVRVANRGAPLTPFLQRSLAAAADDDDDDDNDEDDDEEEEDEDDEDDNEEDDGPRPPNIGAVREQQRQFELILRTAQQNEHTVQALQHTERALQAAERLQAQVAEARQDIADLRETLLGWQQRCAEALEEALEAQRQLQCQQQRVVHLRQRNQQSADRLVELEQSEDRLRLEVAVGAMMIESHQQRIVELEFHLQA